jgi:hypothetical protein
VKTWSQTELDRIGRADELRIASRRKDGTMSKPVIIWVALHGDDLYVRSAVKGANAGWFRAAMTTHQGHVSAGGVEKDVTFVDAFDELADELDAEFRSKYRRYGSIVKSMVTPAARSTTVRLVPR